MLIRGLSSDIAPFVPDVPTAAIDPTALGYFRLFPAPNTNLLGTSNNFLYNPSASFYSSTADVRIDHHFSASDTLFGRYSYNKSNAFTPPLLPSVNGVAAGGSLQPVPGYSNTLVHNGAFGYTHVFTPSLLLELRAGYTFFNLYAPGLNDGKNLNDNAPYRIPNANECLNCSGLAGVNVLGYALLGDPVVTPQSNLEHTTQFAGAMTYTHGRQTFKAGASFIRRNFTFFTPVAPKGLFTFPGPSPQIALHNFFAGAPYVSIRQAYLSKPYDRTWEPSVFFEDDWHPTSRLTFNFGLRYDVFSKPNEKNNNYANYDSELFQPDRQRKWRYPESVQRYLSALSALMRRSGVVSCYAAVQDWPFMSANPITTWCSTIHPSDSIPARSSTLRQFPPPASLP